MGLLMQCQQHLKKTKLLKSEQETLRRPSGDFKQIRRKVEDGIDYEVYEYGNPKHGYHGYQIIFRETREDGEYIKSVGYGAEAESRTHDWAKLDKIT